MENSIQYYYSRGLAPSTKRSYTSAQSRYLKFCEQFSVAVPVPLYEKVLCAYVSFLADLKHQSTKSYLSALRHLQISAGFQDPFAASSWPRLEHVLKGIKRPSVTQRVSRPRLPITPIILRAIHKAWSTQLQDGSWDAVMLWASFCLEFFAFLHAGEFTVPNYRSFDPQTHLSTNDIAVDSHTAPTLMRVSIKASKTDPFHHGVDIFVGQTFDSLCPISAILAYLAMRGESPGFSPVRDLLTTSGLCYLRSRLTPGPIPATALELARQPQPQPNAFRTPLSK